MTAHSSRNNGAKTGKRMPPIEHQFKPGNPGRPKGSRNKLGEAFIEDLHAAWEKHGMAAIEATIKNHPAQFLKVIASCAAEGYEPQHQPICQHDRRADHGASQTGSGPTELPINQTSELATDQIRRCELPSLRLSDPAPVAVCVQPTAHVCSRWTHGARNASRTLHKLPA